MRIAIVNDTVFAVEAMRRVLSMAHGHELAWVARDGVEAVACCAQDTPDLILMDLIMPRMDGIEATRRIMAQNPCAIVVVTASVNRNCSKVFEAMGAGALDCVNTPTLDERRANQGSEALLGKIRTIQRLIGNDEPRNARFEPFSPVPSKSARPSQLIAIGASAGGPAALGVILSQLPKDFPASILIVQHVDPQFTAGFARWLSGETTIAVRLAREGDHPQAATALLAGTGEHLVMTANARLAYTSKPADVLHRPSIDVLFKSLLKEWRGDIIGVLLTGMGRDGAEGLKSLRQAGHHTIVQDRLTSAVFGMPKAAIEHDAASEILPLKQIGPRLIKLVTTRFK